VNIAQSQDWMSKFDRIIETLLTKAYVKCEVEQKEIIQRLFMSKAHMEEGDEFPVIELSDDYVTKTSAFLKFLRINHLSDEK
jgi:hypothetical protein